MCVLQLVACMHGPICNSVPIEAQHLLPPCARAVSDSPCSASPLLCHSFSPCLCPLILTLWETKLFRKESLCMLERGEERERESKTLWCSKQQMRGKDCVKPGRGPVPQTPVQFIFKSQTHQRKYKKNFCFHRFL